MTGEIKAKNKQVRSKTHKAQGALTAACEKETTKSTNNKNSIRSSLFPFSCRKKSQVSGTSRRQHKNYYAWQNI